MDHDPIQVGDLVVFCFDKTKLKEGYFLWAGPDYEPQALDVQFVIKKPIPMIVISIEKFDNILVLVTSGEFGWTRSILLKKII
jgi:hypothetical protein